MATKTCTIEYDAPSSLTGKTGTLSISNENSLFVTNVENNIPPFSVVNSATWSLKAKRGGNYSTSFNAGCIFQCQDSSGNVTKTLLKIGKGANDGIGVPVRTFSCEYTNYISSGTANAGKINTDKAYSIAYYITCNYSFTFTFSEQKITYEITLPTLSLSAGDGGYIEGGSQTFDVDVSTSKTCKAVANSGYVFEKWSDGDTNAERTFTKSDLTATNTAIVAQFKADKVNKIYVGNRLVKGAYIGNTPVKAVYVGNTKVYG